MRYNLDMLKQKREKAVIRMAKYKGQIAQYYNTKVWQRSFKVEDLFLRKNSVSHVHVTNKLDPNWEGPYTVTEARQVR